MGVIWVVMGVIWGVMGVTWGVMGVISGVKGVMGLPGTLRPFSNIRNPLKSH